MAFHSTLAQTPKLCKEVVVPSRLSIVWACRDTPDPYSGGKKNYVIEAPGRYHLKSGKLQQLA